LSVSNIALIGFQASGKTTLGALLAEKLQWNFIDTDASLSRQHAGLSPREIYLRYGPRTFREAEKKVLFEIENKKQLAVIATGGGILESVECGLSLRKHAKLVYLDVPFSLLVKRLPTAPAYLPENQTLHDFYQQRSLLYAEWADLTLKLSDCTKNNFNILCSYFLLNSSIINFLSSRKV
jgi:shikimate kinase